MEVLLAGKCEDRFFQWLDYWFGFYSSNVLVDAVTGSNVIYQFDEEARTMKSSYMSLRFEEIYSWRVVMENGFMYLELLGEEDVVWFRGYMMCLRDIKFGDFEHMKKAYWNE